ncbi:MAG TPA: hypothetical protein PK250_07580 [Syntrophobacter fumaroxidans]|nr:hypothetical protein [Syntrophobacter fumaroxidans]
MSHELVKQTKNALEFVQKLHFEISYLIKEVEGLLQQEEESFTIGKPSGYGVTARTSTGLEPINVENWMPKTFTVFFVPKSMNDANKGQTVTPITSDLKLLLLHIELTGKDLEEPRVIYGTINNISYKNKDYTKFEKMMWEFSYNTKKIFKTIPNVNYEDGTCSLQGKFNQEKLFSIKSSDDVVKKLVDPMLVLFREI